MTLTTRRPLISVSQVTSRTRALPLMEDTGNNRDTTSTRVIRSRCFVTSSGLSLILTVPTLIWGHMLPRTFGYAPPEIPSAHWIPSVLGTAVFLYGGLPFVLGAIRELRDRLPA